jgi:hypothetical protein
MRGAKGKRKPPTNSIGRGEQRTIAAGSPKWKWLATRIAGPWSGMFSRPSMRKRVSAKNASTDSPRKTILTARRPG